MQIPPDVVGFAMVMGTVIGAAFGLKFLIWGKTPLHQLRRDAGDHAAAERLADLEAQIDDLTTLVTDQSRQIEDVQDRLDFTERLLARGPDASPRSTALPPSERA
jgi:uncharacterized coiled-coil protein SlyX